MGWRRGFGAALEAVAWGGGCVCRCCVGSGGLRTGCGTAGGRGWRGWDLDVMC